jgi:hypothetical protein
MGQGNDRTWRPRPPTPPHLRRYGWWRAYRGLPRHSKWRLVAAKTGVPIDRVTIIAIDLIDQASTGRPRGSLAEYSIEECAAHFGFEAEEVARVYACLEEIGWIDQEYLVTWDERQPDQEDQTSAERQQRFRKKKRAERLSPTRNGVTAVTGVTVTTRQDKTLESPPAVKVIHINSGDSGDSLTGKEAAEVWLATEARRILIDQQVAISVGKASAEDQAKTKIERWLRDLNGDAETLAGFIKTVDANHFAGARFLNLIGDQLRRHVATAKNEAMLPLPPQKPQLISDRKRAADD